MSKLQIPAGKFSTKLAAWLPWSPSSCYLPTCEVN